MKHTIISSDREASKLCKYLMTLPSVAWDTETYSDNDLSLDWIRGKQAWHQYSDSKEAWLVQADFKVFKPLLEGPTLKIIHNSAFDAAWTKREHGIRVQNIWDTRYIEQVILGLAIPRELKKADKLLLEPKYSASLKWCLHRRGWPSKLEFEPFYKGVPPTESQIYYMIRDVEFLHKLMLDQHARIKKMGLELICNLENALCEITVEMMTNGFGVDERGWLRTTKNEERIYNHCMKELKAAADINWNSWAQYCKFFGVKKTAELDLIQNPDNTLQVFRVARKHYKNVSTYGRSFLEQHVKDGLLRCQYTQIVNTGRYASDNPNLQNIPSDTPHRSYMIPGHYKNGVFVAPDFSGQEMAIMAAGSQEESWLECLRSGGDLHSMVARDVVSGWNELSAAEQKRQRKIIKIINFSIAYGAGIDTIALRAGETREIISIRLASMKRRYPKLFRWLNDNGQRAKQSWASYSFAPFYRYRSLILEGEDWRRVNIGKNNPVQATAADMTKLAMYLIWQEIQTTNLPCLFIHQLHDELVLECSARYAKRVAKEVVWAMNEACTRILGEPLSRPEVTIKTNWDKR